MKAHDLARILLSMENVEVAYQYYDGGPEMMYEPQVEHVTECNGKVYLTNESFCKHNYIEIDVEEIHCYIEDPNCIRDVYICSFENNIKEMIEYVSTTEGCHISCMGQFDDYANVTFDTQEDLDKFINTFNNENN